MGKNHDRGMNMNIGDAVLELAHEVESLGVHSNQHSIFEVTLMALQLGATPTECDHLITRFMAKQMLLPTRPSLIIHVITNELRDMRAEEEAAKRGEREVDASA